MPNNGTSGEWIIVGFECKMQKWIETDSLGYNFVFGDVPSDPVEALSRRKINN